MFRLFSEPNIIFFSSAEFGLKVSSGNAFSELRGVEWVHYLFLFPIVLGKFGLFCAVLIIYFRKNVIVFFFGNQISKWRSSEKSAIIDLLFTFFSHQGKVTKIPTAHISLTYIHVFCSPY